VRNVFLWMSGVWGELKEVAKLMEELDQLSGQLQQLQSVSSQLDIGLRSLRQELGSIKSSVDVLQTQMSQKAGSALAYTGVALGLIALVLAAFLLAKKR